MDPSRSLRMFLGAATALTLAVLASASSRDTSVHPPPDDYSFRPPAAGATYTDPVFGTKIKRLSDARSTRDYTTGGYLEFVGTPSSSLNAFNSDGSRLLLQHQEHHGLYDGEGNFLKLLPVEISAPNQPRWSRRDPGLLYYVSGNQLKRFDVVTGSITVLRTFHEYASIQGHGQSDLCLDGDHLAIAGDGRHIYLYELSTDRKGPELYTAGNGFGRVSITPNHNVLVSWLAVGSGPFEGVELFDSNMNFLRQLAPAPGASAVARDASGEEVLIWSNAADPLPICANGVVKVRLADAQQTCLLSLDPDLTIEVAAPESGAGWSFVTTSAPDDRSPGERSWPVYANEVLQLKLDRSEIRRLAHHRNRVFGDERYAPRVATDREGTKLVYSSNHGLVSQLKYPQRYRDAYLITLPISPMPRGARAGDQRDKAAAQARASAAAGVSAACGLSDGLVRTLPSLSPPAKGRWYVDPTFGCTIKRLSDATAEGTPYVTHLYSSVNPFNADSTRVLLEKGCGTMHIRDLDGNTVPADLPAAGIQPTSSAFWSRTDPDLIYYRSGNQLKSYDVARRAASAVHTFAGYSAVAFGLGEGDISWDGDHLPVVADGRWGFVFTISTKTSTKAVDLVAFSGSPNHVDVTPGNWYYVAFNRGGTHLWDQRMDYQRKIIANAPHADRTADTDGTDVVVLTNSGDSSLLPDCTNGQVKVRLDAGAASCLQAFPWSFSTHTSCNNVGQGWCLVSTYSRSGWSEYENELLKIRLDGSETLRLAHHRSTSRSYGHIPRAAVSHDGRYVLFDSDMQGSVVDVYLLTVPDVSSATPAPAPTPTPLPRQLRRPRVPRNRTLIRP